MIEERFDYGISLREFFPQDILDGLHEYINTNPPPEIIKSVILEKENELGKRYRSEDKLGHYTIHSHPSIKQAEDFIIEYFHTHPESIIVKEGNGWTEWDKEKSGYTCNGQLQTTPPHNFYNMHRDTPSKLHTMVIYLHPQVGNGTVFFETETKGKDKGINPSEHPWGVNCGYWMGIDGDRPLHTYHNDTNETRWIYMFNLGKKKYA
jgi:hypothetical protein